MGAERIGHGIRAAWSEDMIKELADKNIPLELCPTSNLNTKVVDNIADYPIMKLINNGVKVTINTDNMMVSGTSIKNELKLLVQTFPINGIILKNLLINSKILVIPLLTKAAILPNTPGFSAADATGLAALVSLLPILVAFLTVLIPLDSALPPAADIATSVARFTAPPRPPPPVLTATDAGIVNADAGLPRDAGTDAKPVTIKAPPAPAPTPPAPRPHKVGIMVAPHDPTRT